MRERHVGGARRRGRLGDTPERVLRRSIQRGLSANRQKACTSTQPAHQYAGYPFSVRRPREARVRTTCGADSAAQASAAGAIIRQDNAGRARRARRISAAAIAHARCYGRAGCAAHLGSAHDAQGERGVVVSHEVLRGGAVPEPYTAGGAHRWAGGAPPRRAAAAPALSAAPARSSARRDPRRPLQRRRAHRTEYPPASAISLVHQLAPTPPLPLPAPLASGPHTHRHAHTPHPPAKRTLARTRARAPMPNAACTPLPAPGRGHGILRCALLYGHQLKHTLPTALRSPWQSVTNAALAGNIARCSRALLYGCAFVDAAPRAGRRSVRLLRPARPAKPTHRPGRPSLRGMRPRRSGSRTAPPAGRPSR
jgi:hypothetical protein